MIVDGNVDGVNWSFAISWHHGSSCIISEVDGGPEPGENIGCGGDTQKNYWAGPSVVRTDVGRKGGAVLFFLLNPKVGFLNVRVAERIGDRHRWLHLVGHMIRGEVSSAAHFPYPVAYGVAQADGIVQNDGKICVQRVAVFAKTGKRFEKSPRLLCPSE
jgi:hypothetical protein